MVAHFVYIVECADGTLYTGYTTNVEERVLAHNSGKGARYTRGRLPVTLVFSESHRDKGAALGRERQIKKMSRGLKISLVSTARRS
jgi:putative endonuclease